MKLPSVIYLAAPAGAPTKREHGRNLARAKRWLGWAARQGYAVIADWIIYCEVWDDFNAEDRAQGLAHDDAMIRRCDEFWMVGGRISEGMARGKATAEACGIKIVDLTGLGLEPPGETGR